MNGVIDRDWNPEKVKVSKRFKATLSAALKVPEFCPEVEGNPVP